MFGGRAADLLGRRRIFLVGLVVFSISSLLAGLAWSEPSLIAARAFQGLGAAIITPAALSILSVTFVEGRERNIALGAWGAVGGFGAAAGVLLGGILTDALSWEWIFFVNVPFGARLVGPRSCSESRDAQVKSYDIFGGVLVTAGLSGLVYAITQADRRAGSPAGPSASPPRPSRCSPASWAGSAPPGAAHALRGPADQDRQRRQHRRLHHGHRDVLDVPDPDPLHAAGPGLLRR